MMDKEKGKTFPPELTRKTFLQFAVDSRGKNEDIKESDEVEKGGYGKEKWSACDLSTHDAKGTKAMAWAVFQFSRFVVSRETAAEMKEVEFWENPATLMSKISIDDIAFILITLENSINKWIRLHKILVAKREAAGANGNTELAKRVCLVKADMKNVPGSKFPNGTGISGPEGQKRFNALKIYLFQNLYKKNSETGRENITALAKACHALALKDQKRRDKNGNGNKKVSSKTNNGNHDGLADIEADQNAKDMEELEKFEWSQHIMPTVAV